MIPAFLAKLAAGPTLKLIGVGLVTLAVGAGVWWVQSLRIDLAEAEAQAEMLSAQLDDAIDAAARLEGEMERRAAERARTEAALRQERDVAISRAAARGRALQEIQNAPDGDQPFAPGVAGPLRRLYQSLGTPAGGGAGAGPDRDPGAPAGLSGAAD